MKAYRDFGVTAPIILNVGGREWSASRPVTLPSGTWVGLRACPDVSTTDKRLAAVGIPTPDLPAHTVASLTVLYRILYFVKSSSPKTGMLQCTSDVRKW